MNKQASILRLQKEQNKTKENVRKNIQYRY